MKQEKKLTLTTQIFIAMAAGITIGLIIHYLLPPSAWVNTLFKQGLFDLGGKVFISLLQMVVIPIIFVSLVCGTCSLDDSRQLGRIAGKTLILYIFTTAVAVAIAIIVANILYVGASGAIITPPSSATFTTDKIPSIKDTLLNIIPSNPFHAFANGNILQVIFFAIFVGLSISWLGPKAERVKSLFQELDLVIMRIMHVILKFTPYGVFCLIAKLFATEGIAFVGPLIKYFFTVLLVLGIQLFVVYSLMLSLLSGLSPRIFFKKMFPTMIFAFSTSSSNATIPMMLETTKYKLGVKESVGSFIIPLGATIHMDGTAIMQGVATVFVATTYQIDIGLAGYLTVILTATLASIGTAGIPSVGLVTLTMVLMQVGLPAEGIALIIGVDRLLDMARTVVNTTGDAAVACIVAKSEKEFDIKTFNNTNISDDPKVIS